MRIQVIFGVLLIYTHVVMGSLFQDHVCRFNQIKPCYVAVGQRLYLQMPWEERFDLKSTTNVILRYRKTQSSPPPRYLPRWQFVNDNKTMILTSAERNNSGTYTLNIFDGDGRSKGSSTLQVNIEAQVSSVKLSYSCLFSEVRKVYCSADGDNLHFSFTSDFNTLPQLENGTSTVTLEQDHQGNITCYVENNVSRDHYTIELHQCPGAVHDGRLLETSSAQYNCGFMEFVSVWLLEIIILISLIVAFSIYTNIHRKQRIIKNQESI